jgi:hypothetical protein
VPAIEHLPGTLNNVVMFSAPLQTFAEDPKLLVLQHIGDADEPAALCQQLDTFRTR